MSYMNKKYSIEKRFKSEIELILQITHSNGLFQFPRITVHNFNTCLLTCGEQKECKEYVNFLEYCCLHFFCSPVGRCAAKECLGVLSKINLGFTSSIFLFSGFLLIRMMILDIDYSIYPGIDAGINIAGLLANKQSGKSY
jgi:hypothetical protein